MRSHSVRRLFVESPASLGERARRRRWRRFTELFPNIAEMSVLDLGGTADYWLRAPQPPRHVHVVNLTPMPAECPPWMQVDVADACAIPDGMLADEYDLVHSNSVIEHVGGHRQRQRFASQARGAAPAYWIQTPYRYFPVEPHWVAPFMQFLPLRARSVLGLHWPLAYSRAHDMGESIAEQLAVELLDITQMRHYFPDADLVYERIAGLVKSVIAVRTG